MQNVHTDVTDPDLYYTDQRLHFTGHSHEKQKQQVKMSSNIIIYAQHDGTEEELYMIQVYSIVLSQLSGVCQKTTAIV